MDYQAEAKALGTLGMLVSFLPSASRNLVRANLAVTIRSAYAGDGDLERQLLGALDYAFVEIEKAGKRHYPEGRRAPKRIRKGAA